MERLQKVMAHAGVASRRHCEQLIVAGRVRVNGETVTELGFQVSRKDRIEVDGVQIDKEHPVYFLLYKPQQTISAVHDDRNRRVVTDFFPEVTERIYPIGRLDYNTTGLLLLTNDGSFSQMMMHPKYHVPKTYVAKVRPIPSEQALQRLAKGVVIDGKKTARAKVTCLSVDVAKQTAVISLTIREGWNHQVKKMFAAIQCTVLKLKRDQLGFLTLGNLRPGEWRVLKKHEVQ